MRRLLLALAFVPACTGSLAIAEEPRSLGVGRVRLAVAPAQGRITLERAGTTLLTFDPSAFQLGVAAAFDPAKSYDPWPAAREGRDPDGVRFVAPRSWRDVSEDRGDPAAAAFVLDYGAGLTARLAIAAPSAARFTIVLSPDTGPVVLARVRTRPDARESLYGLGATDSVEQRGKVRPMQLEPDARPEAPVPVLLGTTGWGLFASTSRIGVFDVARRDPSAIEATFAVASADGGRADAFRFDVFAADAPLGLYRELHAVMGPSRAPPPRAFGAWAWRADATEAALLTELASLRQNDVAVTGVGLDPPFAKGVSTFDFDPARFPDGAGMVARARAAGFSFALWSVPYLAEPLATEAAPFFPSVRGALATSWGPPFDFTNPVASEFYRGLVRRYTEVGVDGFALAGGEDVAITSVGDARNRWAFADGSDERTMHYRYAGLYQRAYSDAASGREPARAVDLAAELPFLFVRDARWGNQSLGVVVESAAAVGLAASGFSYAATRSSSNPFLPMFVSAGAVDAAAARLHTRLFPYFYTYAKRAEATGEPVLRPLGLVHPELAGDAFFVGEEVLVAAPGAPLPPGTWYDAATVQPAASGTLLRDGAILPLLRETIDTLSPARQPGVESFANDAGVLGALVLPGPPRACVLWDGARIARAVDGAIEVADGAVFHRGFHLELVAVPRPTSVRSNGVDVPWGHSPERGGTLRVALPPGSGRVTIR